MKPKILNCFFYLLIFLLINCSDGKKKSSDTGIPKRIISLGPRITESLYLLDAGNELIANTIYCKHPDEAKDKIKIGNMVKIDLEKVYKLNPDLVLCTSLSSPEQIKKLQKLGINTFTFNQAKNFNEMCQQFLNLGDLIGKTDKAKKIINNAKIRVTSLIKSIKNTNKPKVFIQIGMKPLFTVTKDSFINDFIKFGGGINIAEDSGSGIYSRENVLQLNPDVIIITSMGIETKVEMKKWQKYTSINAVKTGRIHTVDQYKMCSPTIVSFADTLKEMIAILHEK